MKRLNTISRKFRHIHGDTASGRLDYITPPRLIMGLLDGADVAFDGQRPQDICIHDADVYRRVMTKGSLGFGEAYMEELWDCARLDVLFEKLIAAGINQKVRHLPKIQMLFGNIRDYLGESLINRQSKKRAPAVARRHYDIGNDLFEAMLDPTMSYSCGYWKNADNLDEAQQNKLDMICRKLELKPGEHLLDIGCGWGGLAHHAASNYGARVLGVTLSREQAAYARDRCSGLPVEIGLTDYRDLQGKFDKIVSVGMFEHVGVKNYRLFFDKVCHMLSDDGLFLLHTIGDSATDVLPDPWIEEYIFPNNGLPSAKQIAAAIEPGLVIRDWHDFGFDYDKTLMAWWENFERAWPTLSETYSHSFYRMWKYYLHVCAASFRVGLTYLWQIVLSKPSARPDYRSVRL